MANLDITRHRAAPQFHYTGARMQQGRTLLDSDWNEDALHASEDRRLTVVDLIGAQGSSNNGFAVRDVVVIPGTSATAGVAVESTFDFQLQPGSMFVGGMRLVLESVESFRRQSDWLRHDLESSPEPPTLAELLPNPLPANNKAAVLFAEPQYRYDLVFLLAWEQPVTAVEDAELRERALGGPDSSARIRQMRQVHVERDVGTDVASEALEILLAGGNVTFDAQTGEAVSNARLTVTPLAPGGESPCGTQLPDGYVGHEEAAIRVELRGPNSFTWGFGDAAPLYRVKVGADGRRITFLNKPRDAWHQPRAEQIVEIVPWGAKLPNDEKVADLQGELFRVLTGYEPATGELVLAEPVSTEWMDWIVAHRADRSRKDGDDGDYFYLRLWDRGADTSSPLTLELGPTPVELGKTGLQVSLEGLGESGDYWVIAARRATPDVVVPWELLTSAAPHGPRRFFAALAIIRWEAPLQFLTTAEFAAQGGNIAGHHLLPLVDGKVAVWGPVTAVPIDARRRLQRLCIGGCCTITVGDGTTSHGVVDSLEDALALLPSSGGRICLLPGQHPSAVILDGRQNVEIHGGGPHCLLVNAANITPGEEFTYTEDPIITLRDCTNIQLRDFMVNANGAVGVKIYGVASQCEGIAIERVWFNQDGFYEPGLPQQFALPQPAVLALGGEDITIRDCRVEVHEVLSYSGALVVGGERLRILDNWVQGGDFESTSVVECMGGIHVLSQSSDVEIAGNVIHGGWGHGIALGHVLSWDLDPGEPMTIGMSQVWAAAARGLGEPVTELFGYEPDTDAPIGDPGEEKGWTSAGPLADIRIDRNRITGMGLSGISTTMMRLNHTNTSGGAEPAFIVIARLSVTNNVVIGNRRSSSFSPPELFDPRSDGSYELAVGGIVIAAGIDVTVAENRVVDNGADAVWPNCGLGFIAMQNLVVRDNHVADNGIEATVAVPEGLSGGIAIMEVAGLRGDTYNHTIHALVTFHEDAQLDYTIGASKQSLQVHENEVAQRSGRALWVNRGFDDISVTHNSFFAKGDLVAGTGSEDFELEYETDTDNLSLPLAGACVEIFGFSRAPDIDWSAVASPTRLYMVDPGAVGSMGGTIEFSGNRGELDWTNDGGHASAYLFSCLDSVVLADNVLIANLHGEPASYTEAFVNALIAEPDDKSFVITNCYVGTVGGALIRGNRFIEDLTGALVSVIIGPILQEPVAAQILREGSVIRSIVATHCGVLDPSPSGLDFANHIIFINPRPGGDGCDYDVTFNPGSPNKLTLS